MPEDAEITRLLNSVDQGDRALVDQLVARVYPDLEAIAHRHLYGERADHTLNTNALVHEAYLRLAQQDGAPWENRAHFFGRPSSGAHQRAKAELLECFCPRSDRWREKVVEQGLAIIDRAVRSQRIG